MLIFIHVPRFYAAVEQADELRLRDLPVAVGGDPGKGGSVISASAEAAAAGVEPGMRLSDASRVCPGLELRATRLPRYREVSAEIHATLRNVTERMEPLALDGVYLEPPRNSEPIEIAAVVCVRLQAELSLRAVAGIGPSKFVAWLAARHAGPGGVKQVKPPEVPRFLRDLPVTEIWGLGPATAARLAASGVSTMGELRDCPLDELRDAVGRQAGPFRELARGEDHEPLRPSTPVKSVSREKTLDEPTGDLRALGEHLLELSGGLEERLNRERRSALTVTLGVRFVDGDDRTRTLTRREAISSQNELHEVALELLGRVGAGERDVRAVRLRAANLTRAGNETEPRQLRLF
jgi:DNA polymerase-4